MILLLLGISAMTVGVAQATSCQSLQQSQLASLNERMNQMISALYSSPFSKSKQSGTSYQSSTPAPQSEYSSSVPQYEPPCYHGYQPSPAPPPHVVYMSQPHSSAPATVAFSPPVPGSPPTVTISSTRVPSTSCYSQYEGQEYAYQAPKPYPPQYYEYYSQYSPPAPYQPSPQYTPQMECTCQYSSEYSPAASSSCPHRPTTYSAPPPVQPEYASGSCPSAPAPPCAPPAYAPAQYQQLPSYPPPAYPSPPAYPPPPYPPSYGPPAYPPPSPYPSAYTNPRDVIQPPQYM